MISLNNNITCVCHRLPQAHVLIDLAESSRQFSISIINTYKYSKLCVKENLSAIHNRDSEPSHYNMFKRSIAYCLSIRSLSTDTYH